MNPLPNEWAITHRADACAVTHRPFEAGEYFYTLLYHSRDGYRREDLPEGLLDHEALILWGDQGLMAADNKPTLLVVDECA